VPNFQNLCVVLPGLYISDFKIIMRNHKTFKLLLGILLFISTGCEKLYENDIYKRPDWLPGKLYTTVSEQENLTLFAECLQLAGLDSVLDVSGSWSVFAPTDEAVKQFLSENQYAGVSDIPSDELERITEFHIIQNPWSLDQLQSLSIFGWRTEEDTKKNTFAFKRETMFKNSDGKYWVEKNHKKEEMIVIDSTRSDDYKKVFVESRKYVPIFYDEYMDRNGLGTEDYSFYFDREYEQGNIYYAGGKIIKADIFAENGFVHIIDKVVSPMLNGKEILEREMPGESYKLFLEMIYWYYPDFEPNIEATFNQPAVIRGGLVDTLWDLKFFNPVFDIQKELIGFKGPEVNETLVKHNGLVAPEDDAFSAFVDGILTRNSGFPHWPDHKQLPMDVADFVFSRHFVSAPIYPTKKQYKNIFRRNNGFKQNEDKIIRKEFGSNCTFIGMKSYNPDRVFTSVTGPVFLRPSYSIFRRALQYANIYEEIAYNDDELYFFAIPDGALRTDSSLMINWIDRDKDIYNFIQLNARTEKMEVVGRNTLKNMILNQVGSPVPNGTGNNESIRTLGGKYITWDHSSNTVRGNLPCRVWNTGEIVDCIPTPLEEPADNGKTYRVDYWFSFRGI